MTYVIHHVEWIVVGGAMSVHQNPNDSFALYFPGAYNYNLDAGKGVSLILQFPTSVCFAIDGGLSPSNLLNLFGTLLDSPLFHVLGHESENEG